MKKHLLLIIFLLFFVGWQVQAQTDNEISQIEQTIAEGNLSDEEIFDSYNGLMWDSHYQGKQEQALSCFNKGIAFAREKKNIDWEAAFLVGMGFIYHEWGENDIALTYFDNSIKLLDGKGIYYREAYAYQGRGCYFRNLNNYERSMEDFLKALEINEKDRARDKAAKEDYSGTYRVEVSILNNMAVIFANQFNNEKCLEYQLQIKKIMDDNPTTDFRNWKYVVPNNIASLLIDLDRYEEAFPLIEEAYKLAAEIEHLDFMVSGLIRYAVYYAWAGKPKLRLQYALEALQVAEKSDVPRIINKAEAVLIKAYFALRDYKKALYYANRMLLRLGDDDDDNEGNWKQLQFVYGDLALIHAALGKPDEAENYMDKFVAIVAKLSDKNQQNALEEMQVKYEVEKKEQAHQAEISRHETRQAIFIGSLLFTALLIALLIYIVALRNKRNRELAEMNATKDKFFSIISHDLKNPAIAQRDALQLLLDNSDKWDKDALANYYGKLLKSADSQVILLYNMLNWAYLQTGKMPFMPNPFNLKAALKSDIALIQNMAEQKGVTFNINIPEQTTITGDDNMLTIVIRNLLTNAVKFTTAGGTVTLDIAPIGSGFTISISDTGTGMTPEQLQNLFCLDAKRSTTGTAGEQGSGLGLIVCKELVEKHGSTLNVDSERGMGSRFWFEI